MSQTVVTNATTGEVFAEQRLAGRAGDLDVLKGLPPGQLQEASLVVCHNWDVTRRIVYRPRPGECAQGLEARVPRAGLVRLVAGRGPRGLVFRGFTFAGGDAGASARQKEPMQAGFDDEAAVVFDAARACAFEDCTFRHTGGYAVWFRDACQDCRIVRCHVYDCGSGGIRAGGTDRAKVSARSSVPPAPWAARRRPSLAHDFTSERPYTSRPRHRMPSARPLPQHAQFSLQARRRRPGRAPRTCSRTPPQAVASPQDEISLRNNLAGGRRGARHAGRRAPEMVN